MILVPWFVKENQKQYFLGTQKYYLFHYCLKIQNLDPQQSKLKVPEEQIYLKMLKRYQLIEQVNQAKNLIYFVLMA